MGKFVFFPLCATANHLVSNIYLDAVAANFEFPNDKPNTEKAELNPWAIRYHAPGVADSSVSAVDLNSN
jgi:hypothetical protein